MEFKILLLISLLLVLAKSQNDQESESPPIVQISNGLIRGVIGKSSKGRRVYEFKGIKYGHIPKRFAESEENAEKWENETKAMNNFGPHCRQYDFSGRKFRGEEQCLYLNVYSRNLDPNAKLPIIFFIHGGAFAFGSAGDYEPIYLLNEDIVVVAINYRVGPLGFLNAGIKESPGNQGLKDQVLALKWVQQNIESFGGDKSLVTIYGESAGAASVSYHVLSPASKGLFSRAISHSGTNYAPWALMKEPELIAKKFAQELDCPTSNPQYMVQCLQKLDSEVLLESMKSVLDIKKFFDGPQEIYFGGSIESGYVSPNVFLTQDPNAIYEESGPNKVPFMIGVNSKEGAFFGATDIQNNPNLTKIWNDGGWESFLPRFMRFGKSAKRQCGLVSSLWDQYFPGLEKIGKKDQNQLENMFSDIMVFSSARRSAQRHSNSSTPTYLYHFSLKGHNSLQQYYQFKYPESFTPSPDGQYDPSHIDDLQYFFKIDKIFPLFQKTEKFERDSERLVKLWVSFARDGSPSALWGNEMKEWPEFNPEKPTWIDINEEIKELKEDRIFESRMKFWDSFLEDIY